MTWLANTAVTVLCVFAIILNTYTLIRVVNNNDTLTRLEDLLNQKTQDRYYKSDAIREHAYIQERLKVLEERVTALEKELKK